MEFKEITSNIANMFFPNTGLDKPADKGFSDFVRVENKKNTVHSKDERVSAVSQSPQKEIVRKEGAVIKDSKSQKSETVVVDKDISSESLDLNLNEVAKEVVVEEAVVVDIVDELITPEVFVVSEEDVLVDAVYVEPVISEDVLLKAVVVQDKKEILIDEVDEKVVKLDEKVVKLDGLEVVAPEEFIEPEVLVEKNVEQKVEKEVVLEKKPDVEKGQVFVSDKSINIKVVDLDGKETKKVSTQKIISNDFELVKMLSSDEVVASPVESLEVDEFSKVVNKDVVVADKEVSLKEEVVEVSLEEIIENPEEVMDSAFVSDEVVDVDFDALITSTPITSDVKKFDTVIDEKISLRDAFKGMSKEAVEQVRVNITKSAIQGLSKIDIHLKPEGLGMVEIKLNIGKDGKMQASIVASRVETMEVLQKDSVVLAKSLSDAGFDMSSDDFNFSFANKDDGDSRKGLKEFISKTLREDVEIANYEKEFINSSAVNIRV